MQDWSDFQFPFQVPRNWKLDLRARGARPIRYFGISDQQCRIGPIFNSPFYRVTSRARDLEYRPPRGNFDITSPEVGVNLFTRLVQQLLLSVTPMTGFTGVIMQFKGEQRSPLLSTAAVARWFGVSTRTVCLWAECGEIPAMKLGRQWRFREEELRRWLVTGQDKILNRRSASSAFS
jgi:excisionase family DNA binding protein